MVNVGLPYFSHSQNNYMISGFFLILFSNILAAAAAVLPTQGLPDGIINAFQYLVDSMYKFSDIIPVTSILQVLVAALTFEVLVFGYKSTIWVYNKVRGATGSR